MQLIYGGKKVKESQGLLFVKYLAYGLILSIFQIQKGLWNFLMKLLLPTWITKKVKLPKEQKTLTQ